MQAYKEYVKSLFSYSSLNTSVITIESYFSSNLDMTSTKIGYAIVRIALVNAIQISKVDILGFNFRVTYVEITVFQY